MVAHPEWPISRLSRNALRRQADNDDALVRVHRSATRNVRLSGRWHADHDLHPFK